MTLPPIYALDLRFLGPQYRFDAKDIPLNKTSGFQRKTWKEHKNA